MKKIKSKTVRDYVMNDMVWKVDLPMFLKEISECSDYVPYAASFRILAQVLNVLTERAIEINDPALNIIMLNLGLYEEAHDKNAEECWQEMQKNQPFGWVKLKDTESGYYMLKGMASQVVIGFNENPFSYKKVFEDYTFANGTPFGVKIDEE